MQVAGFRDDKLKVEEEKGYPDRTVSIPESYDEEGFYERRHAFGTMTIVTNISLTADQIYTTFKTRNTVEVMFDGLKTIWQPTALTCKMKMDYKVGCLSITSLFIGIISSAKCCIRPNC